MELLLKSINIGQVRDFPYEKGKVLHSGINKLPVDGKVYVSSINIEGDEQADLKNHGGPNKAVCAYSYKHYPFWEKSLATQLTPGAFGENFTIDGFNEDEIFIGDIFEVGDVVLQVSLPRMPCYKLGQKLGNKDLPLAIQESGLTGCYFRVLKEGYCTAGEVIKRVNIHPKKISISFVNNVKYKDQHNKEALKTLVDLVELDQNWRDSFHQRLLKLN
ncbi:MOSC domain-containing protein [Bacillus timonensis]|nr:MOSC domain-containing protein [Bacillus timonensis]